MFKTLVHAFDPRPDAISLLKQDHRKVEALFEEFEAATNQGSQWRIAQKICAELEVHAQIEEAIFYPAVKKGAPAAKDEVDEGVVEHMAIKRLIREIQRMSASDELFEAKVKVLIEYTKHHVREEENVMFPMITESDMDLQALEQRLLVAKQKLLKDKSPQRVSSRKSPAKKTPRKALIQKRARSGASAQHV